MIDSDITGDMTADCQELMPTHKTNNAHATDCTCDSCCCETSTSNCQDNRDECEESEQHTERLKKMKDKFVPIIATCAVILAFGISGTSKEISAADSISANTIEVSRRAKISEINRLDIVEVNRSIDIADVQIGPQVAIEQINSIEIPSRQIASTIRNVIAG